MEEVFIPAERIGLLKSDKKAQTLIESACHCRLSVKDGEGVIIEGKPYDEFVAKNVIYAFGRGFDMEIARRLLNDDIYFSSVDLRHALGSEKRVARIKARVIGESGRTKRYIESVSSARMSVYGDTVSFIGDMYEIREAETAVNTLIEGGTHKLAYLRMEAAHRKNKEESTTPKF